MRVEHERVRTVEAGEQGTPRLGEHRGRPVRAVDVQPQPVVGAEVRELGQRVDGAAARRARVRDQAERRETGGPVGLDRRTHGTRIEPAAGTGGHHADLRHAEDPQRPRERYVALRGHVGDRRLGGALAEARRPRGGQRDEAGDRPAGDQHALRAVGQPAQLAQPVEHHELDGGRPRAAGPRAREHVVARRHGVGEDAHVVARTADTSEEPRMVGGLDERQHLIEEGVERGVGVARVLGRRSPEGGTQLRRVPHADRRQLVDRGQALDDPVHDAVPEPAHLVRRERQRLGHPAFIPAVRSRPVRWR